MVFEVHTSSISTLIPYDSFRACDLSIFDGVAIMVLVIFIAASFATLPLHQRKYLEPFASSAEAHAQSGHAACQVNDGRLYTLSSVLQSLLAKGFSLPTTTSVATMKHLSLILMLLLPTLVEGNNNTMSNADVLRWTRTAPRAVLENFRITLSNEIVFRQGLFPGLFPPLPLPPKFPPHIPFPPCILVDCCPWCPDFRNPGDIFEWVRVAPIGIRRNFEISVIFNDVSRGSLLSREKDEPPNEILIRRLWVAAFAD